ncbi:hypothetical protein Barb7_00038 [Bacteroidales bacterium Barb7]|nr:hypothetical protein Barb7_00061 [Bacteroidales bacterium Barb7]OAV76296.1 hypothetical protein Barb7_00010 [Bacteroidales bacterium Barb7]OAV76324.1 hypothetical protein Barb7_00038 [Bacteroidales bacterium Barb7]
MFLAKKHPDCEVRVLCFFDPKYLQYLPFGIIIGNNQLSSVYSLKLKKGSRTVKSDCLCFFRNILYINECLFQYLHRIISTILTTPYYLTCCYTKYNSSNFVIPISSSSYRHFFKIAYFKAASITN